MVYVGGFIFAASHGQAFQGPLAKPGVHRVDYYRLRVLPPGSLEAFGSDDHYPARE